MRSIKDQTYEFEKHIQKPSVAYLHHRLERHSVLKMLPLLSLPAFLDDFSLAEEKRELETGQGKKFLETHLEATQHPTSPAATFGSIWLSNCGDLLVWVAFLLSCLNFTHFFTRSNYGRMIRPIMVTSLGAFLLFCYCPLLNKVDCGIIGVTEITTII